MRLWADGSDGWGTAVDCIHYRNAVKVARKLTNRDRESYAVLNFGPHQLHQSFTVVTLRLAEFAKQTEYVCHAVEVAD